MRLRPALFLLSVVCCAAAASCDRTPAQPAATSAASESAPGAGGGLRIVSTVPAATLNLVLIGAADKLVGVTKYDRLYLPPAQQNLPVVGDYLTMDYEQLIKLKPSTLIVQFAPNRIPMQLSDVIAREHIDLLNVRFDHISDIWTTVEALGKAAGMEDAAKRSIERAQGDLQRVMAEHKNGPHPKVVYLMNREGTFLAGANTFVDEMITAAGGENAGAKVASGFPDIDRDTIEKLAPDVLLVGAFDELPASPGDPRLAPWLALHIPAATSHRVYLVTDGDSVSASVNVGKNIEALAGLIHQGEAVAPATTPAGGPP